ncbi:MAG: helix-turn-helix transcriptional regulator, partial [Oscillibacter sp.]|nr:helix-turn-helix transcriptional regulator [Oscillibacter sp.]
MCSETFLRLPEEKKNRFLSAAWAEFTRVRFADTSINQIVRRAGIARGSFYQYFKDKEDLLRYMLESGWDYLTAGYYGVLREVEG